MWSNVGPVPELDVEPLCRVQSKSSALRIKGQSHTQQILNKVMVKCNLTLIVIKHKEQTGADTVSSSSKSACSQFSEAVEQVNENKVNTISLYAILSCAGIDGVLQFRYLLLEPPGFKTAQ